MSKIKWTPALLTAALLLAACDSEIAKEAKRAEADGRIIENGLMGSLYPETFYPGDRSGSNSASWELLFVHDIAAVTADPALQMDRMAR